MHLLSEWELDEQKFHDGAVQEYIDSITYAFWYQYMNTLYRQLALYEFSTEALILDLGCGPCVYSAQFLPVQLPSGARYLGVDLSLKMLQEGQKQMGSTSVKNYFSQSLTTELPVQSHSVDICIIGGLIHHLPPEQHEEVFKEVARVLHSGGLAFLHEPKVDYFEDGFSPHEKGLDPVQLLSNLEQAGLELIHYSEHHVPLLYRILKKLQLLRLRPGVVPNAIWKPISALDRILIRLGAAGADMTVVARCTTESNGAGE